MRMDGNVRGVAVGPSDADHMGIGHTGGLLTIDLDAVRANYRLLRGKLRGAECGAVVKADGYGLGAGLVARALLGEGCRTFFTAHLDEALALRPLVSAEARIVVLHGSTPGSESAFEAHGVIPVLNSPEQVAAYAGLARTLGRRLVAWLQVDTGMARFGLSEPELDALLAQPGQMSGLSLEVVMSHLACADDPDHAANAAQLACFGRMRARFPEARASLSASSGIFLGSAFHFDIVRPGAALYGVNPQPGRVNPLASVVRLQGVVMQTRQVPAGTPIGYGHTRVAARPSLLATIAVGYADGFLRNTGADGAVFLGDARLGLMGRVSMDSIIVDATGQEVQVGMLVDLIGPHHDIDAVGAAAGTVGYEILTSLRHRYARRVLGG